MLSPNHRAKDPEQVDGMSVTIAELDRIMMQADYCVAGKVKVIFSSEAGVQDIHVCRSEVKACDLCSSLLVSTQHHSQCGSRVIPLLIA